MSDNSKLSSNNSGPGSRGLQRSISPAAPVPRRRPIPCKGHTKSRAGCLKCKSRKVKCDELTPRCGPCHRLRLVCEFPSPNPSGIETTPKSNEEAGALATTTLTKTLTLETRPGTFGMTDLRFFQHFLVSAHPPFPIGGRLVWLGVSQMAHEFDFLAHSILGLGASHLSMFSPISYTQEALRHRVIAIKSLNEFLSRGDRSLVDVEAAFAATLTLSYQAAHMPDGLYEFLTITRGCFLVGELFGSGFLSCAFRSFERETYVDKVMELFAQRPHYFMGLDLAAGFCDSLEKLGKVCRSVAEIEYLALMRKIASLVVTDMAESYRQYTFLYENLARLSSPEYASFIDANNHVSRLVIMHMLVLDYIMSCRIEDGHQHHHSGFGETRECYNSRSLMICVWVVDIDATLPVELGDFAAWPVAFVRNLMRRRNMDDGFWGRLLGEARGMDRLLSEEQRKIK